MRRLVVLATLAAALAAPAFAANRSSGIAAYERATRTLWLDGRDAYIVPQGVNTARLSNALDVTVTWEQQGNSRVVTKYTVDRVQGEGER